MSFEKPPIPQTLEQGPKEEKPEEEKEEEKAKEGLKKELGQEEKLETKKIKETEIKKEKLEEEKIEKAEIKEPKKEKPEKKPEETKEKAKIEEKLIKFRIGEKDLEKIKGFNDLSYGQKLLVIENFKQLTLARIKEEAAQKYKEEIKKANFLKRIWKGITKQYQITKLEKATAKELLKGDIEIHKDLLGQLVKGTKDLGLEVAETPEGKLEIHYASGFKDLKPEQQEKIKKFNEIANKYSKIPYEWSLETASKKQREKFEAIKQEYEKAKKDILQIKTEKEGEKQALLYLSELDTKIELNQFLNTHPEVEKELESITSKRAWAKALKDIATERGIYFTAGFVTRSVTISLLGSIGMPIAAGVVGGWISKERAKKELKEKEILARKGEKFEGKEAKNIIDAEKLIKKIENVMKKIESTEKEEEKGKLLNHLKARLKYSKDKIDDGLVNFGKIENRLKNQYDLAMIINKGDIFLAAHQDKIIVNKLEERLENFLKIRERRIKKSQKAYIRKQMIKGAIFAAAAATAGYALRHLIAEWFPKNHKIAHEAVTTHTGKAGIAGIEHKTLPIGPIEKFHHILPIGKRGPEGAIIDYFKNNPTVAKSFGWDGQTNLAEWAGRKAHLMWLENAKEALKRPEVLEQLKKLGYSQDLNGYENLMRRIGKGFIDLKPETKNFDFVDMSYLKARTGGILEGANTPEIVKNLTEKVYHTQEIANVKYLGFNKNEYKAIQNIKIEKLLKEIPEDVNKCWDKFFNRQGTMVDLPHFKDYDIDEFSKQLWLAKYIRSLNLPEEMKHLTVHELLQKTSLANQTILKSSESIGELMNKLFNANEIINIESLNLSFREYRNLQGMTIADLLKNFPQGKYETLELTFRERLNLPEGFSLPKASVIRRLINFVKSYNLTDEMKNLTLKEFFRRASPEGKFYPKF